MFTASDAGCYADSIHGHAHVRARLADLLVHMFRHSPHWPTVSDLVDSLRAPMPDDASDENDALAMLNAYAVDWSCFFDIDCGDLILRPVDLDPVAG